MLSTPAPPTYKSSSRGTRIACRSLLRMTGADSISERRSVHYDEKEYGRDAFQSPVRPNRRTSLIVDPPDGRIPPRTPEALKRQADEAVTERAKGPDVTSPGLYTRCVTGNQGPPRIPGGVNTESQIVQTPGYVRIPTVPSPLLEVAPRLGTSRTHSIRAVRAPRVAP